MDVVTNKLLRDAVPLFRALAGVLLALGIGAILMLAKEFLIPLALAILLSFALSPVMSRLQRLGLARAPAALIAVIGAICIIIAVGYTVYSQLAEFAADLPNYRETIQLKIRGIIGSMQGGGPFSRAGDVLADVIGDIRKMSADVSPHVQPQTVTIDSGDSGKLETLMNILEPVLYPVVKLAEIFLLTAFLLLEREDLRNRVIRLMGEKDIQQTTSTLDQTGKRLGRMLLMQLLVNASFGFAVGLGLMLIGLPSPFLWGVLAGVMRFVPYIGAILGLLPPLLIAFAVDRNWSSFMWTLGLFAVIEPIVGHVVEPTLYGKSTGLSPLAVVVSAMLWAFLWGIIGLVLAIPLTIVLVVLGQHVRRLGFLDILLGDRPALQPHEIFYQRMLAGDPVEARALAREVLQQSTLATYYDEIALPGVQRAHLDIERGTVSDERLKTLVDTTHKLVADLAQDVPPPSWRRRVSPEAEAVFATFREQRAAGRVRLGREALPQPWSAPKPVVILHGDHPLDAATATMLGQVFTRHGLENRVMSLTSAARSKPEDAVGLGLVCLSFVEPLTTTHLRAATRAVRQRAPKIPIIMAIWQQTEDEVMKSLRKQMRVNFVVNTMTDAIEAVDKIIDKLRTPMMTAAAPPAEPKAAAKSA